LGTYIITWQRPGKDDDGNAIKNLKVWRTVVGEGEEPNIVGKFVQKQQTGWNLQYTSDEKFCARSVTNEVQFYESGDLGTVWNKLIIEGVTNFAVSPGKNHSVAVFVPERKVRILEYAMFGVESILIIHSGPSSCRQAFPSSSVQLSSITEDVL
jgi:translation initiation factor 2A